MAILSDAALSPIQELRRYDSMAVELCETENIYLGEKQELARREIALHIAAALENEPFPTPLALHPDRIADHIVVTPRLRHCLDLKTIALIYQDAYGNQSNPRLEGRYREFHQRANSALDDLLSNGVGFALNPLPRPGRPAVAFETGASAAGDYVAVVTWVNALHQESEASAPLLIGKPDNSRMVIHPAPAPRVVQGWNLYLGRAGAALGLQNLQPLTPEASWTEPPSGLILGPAPTTEQQPDLYLRRRNVLLRG